MMFRAARWFGGVMMVVVGASGAALSLFFIGHIAWAANRIAHHAPVAIAQLEQMVDSIEQRGSDASNIVQATRERLQWVRETVDELPAEAPDRRMPAVLTTVNVEIVASLERAETFVRSMQTNLETASGALLLLESIPFLGASFSQPLDNKGQSNLKNLASGLREISATLSQGAELLSEIRRGGGVDPAQLARLQEALEQVDLQLVQIQAEVDRFSAAVTVMDQQLDDAEAQLRQRLHWMAGLGITFFVCFGFSQLSLILQGWRAMRPLTRTAVSVGLT